MTYMQFITHSITRITPYLPRPFYEVGLGIALDSSLRNGLNQGLSLLQKSEIQREALELMQTSQLMPAVIRTALAAQSVFILAYLMSTDPFFREMPYILIPLGAFISLPMTVIATGLYTLYKTAQKVVEAFKQRSLSDVNEQLGYALFWGHIGSYLFKYHDVISFGLVEQLMPALTKKLTSHWINSMPL